MDVDPFGGQRGVRSQRPEKAASFETISQFLGLNLGDGTSHLLDLRFADDIFLFGESAQAVV